MKHGVYFGGKKRRTAPCPPLSSARASKSKMAPRGVVEGQVGRWVPDTLWHVCAKLPVMSGLDSVHFVGEGLTWQVGRDANDHFLLLFFSSMNAKGKTGCLAHLWVAWWTCDWQICMTEVAEYMQTNRQGQSQHVLNLLFGQEQVQKASVCTSSCPLEYKVKQHSICGVKNYRVYLSDLIMN